MTRRPSLAESMRQAAQPAAPPPTPATNTKEPRKALRAEQNAGGARFHAATRVGKKKVTANLPPAKHKLLKALAVQRETTTEALLDEAIGDLFTKYNVP